MWNRRLFLKGRQPENRDFRYFERKSDEEVEIFVKPNIGDPWLGCSCHGCVICLLLRPFQKGGNTCGSDFGERCNLECVVTKVVKPTAKRFEAESMASKHRSGLNFPEALGTKKVIYKCQ